MQHRDATETDLPAIVYLLTTSRERAAAQNFDAHLGFAHSHAGMKISLEP